MSKLETLNTAVEALQQHTSDAMVGVAKKLHRFARQLMAVLEATWIPLKAQLSGVELQTTTMTLNATMDALLVAATELGEIDKKFASGTWEALETAQVEGIVTDAVDVLMDGTVASAQTQEAIGAHLKMAVMKALQTGPHELQAAVKKIGDIEISELRSAAVADAKAVSKAMEKAARDADTQAKALMPRFWSHPVGSAEHRMAVAELLYLSAIVLREVSKAVTEARKTIKVSEAHWDRMKRLLDASVQSVSSGVVKLKAGIAGLSANELAFDFKLARAFFQTQKAIPAGIKNLKDESCRVKTGLKMRAALTVNKSRLLTETTHQAITRGMSLTTPDTMATTAALGRVPLALLSTTQKMLAAAQQLTAPASAVQPQEMKINQVLKKASHTVVVLKWDDESARREELRAALHTASSDERRIELMAEAALTAVVETALASTSVGGKGRPRQADEKSLIQEALSAAAQAALGIADDLAGQAAEDTLIGEMQAALRYVSWEKRKQAEQLLDQLAEKLKPAARKITSAASDLRAAAHAASESRHEETLRLAGEARSKATAAKAEIKLAAILILGLPLHQHARGGLLAQAIGEWVHAEKEAYLHANPEVDPAIIDRAMAQLLGEDIREDFYTESDPDGVLLLQRIDLATADAVKGAMTWPLTPDDILARTPTIPEYLRRWGEKKISYTMALGLVSEAVGQGAAALEHLVSVNPRKNMLTPRLRYLKIALAPITIAMGVRALLRSVRPGDDIPYDHIKKYLRRKAFMLAFRLLTSVLPAVVNNAMAIAFTASGLYRGGQYRDDFMRRAKSRIPMDFLQAGGRELWLGFFPSLATSNERSVSDTGEPNKAVSRVARHLLRRDLDASAVDEADKHRVGRGLSSEDAIHRQEPPGDAPLSQHTPGRDLAAIDESGTTMHKAIRAYRRHMPTAAFHHVSPAEFQALLQERYGMTDADLLGFQILTTDSTLHSVPDFLALLGGKVDLERGRMVAPDPFFRMGVVDDIEAYLASHEEDKAQSYLHYHQYIATSGSDIVDPMRLLEYEIDKDAARYGRADMTPQTKLKIQVRSVFVPTFSTSQLIGQELEVTVADIKSGHWRRKYIENMGWLRDLLAKLSYGHLSIKTAEDMDGAPLSHELLAALQRPGLALLHEELLNNYYQATAESIHAYNEMRILSRLNAIIVDKQKYNLTIEDERRIQRFAERDQRHQVQLVKTRGGGVGSLKEESLANIFGIPLENGRLLLVSVLNESKQGWVVEKSDFGSIDLASGIRTSPLFTGNAEFKQWIYPHLSLGEQMRSIVPKKQESEDERAKNLIARYGRAWYEVYGKELISQKQTSDSLAYELSFDALLESHTITTMDLGRQLARFTMEHSRYAMDELEFTSGELTIARAKDAAVAVAEMALDMLSGHLSRGITMPLQNLRVLRYLARGAIEETISAGSRVTTALTGQSAHERDAATQSMLPGALIGLGTRTGIDAGRRFGKNRLGHRMDGAAKNRSAALSSRYREVSSGMGEHIRGMSWDSAKASEKATMVYRTVLGTREFDILSAKMGDARGKRILGRKLFPSENGATEKNTAWRTFDEETGRINKSLVSRIAKRDSRELRKIVARRLKDWKIPDSRKFRNLPTTHELRNLYSGQNGRSLNWLGISSKKQLRQAIRGNDNGDRLRMKHDRDLLDLLDSIEKSDARSDAVRVAHLNRLRTKTMNALFSTRPGSDVPLSLASAPKSRSLMLFLVEIQTQKELIRRRQLQLRLSEGAMPETSAFSTTGDVPPGLRRYNGREDAGTMMPPAGSGRHVVSPTNAEQPTTSRGASEKQNVSPNEWNSHETEGRQENRKTLGHYFGTPNRDNNALMRASPDNRTDEVGFTGAHRSAADMPTLLQHEKNGPQHKGINDEDELIHHHFAPSAVFKRIELPDVPDTIQVGYRTLSNDNYVQFYTNSTGETGSPTLIVSAHGGYKPMDAFLPPVILPPDVTLKFLSPHGTYLFDPGLDFLANHPGKYDAYVNIKGDVNTVGTFYPQRHDAWYLPDDYDPYKMSNRMGRPDGKLQDYRHFQFENESQEHIARVLIANRTIAVDNPRAKADILVMNDSIIRAEDTDPMRAGTQAIMTLDGSGKLVNSTGERYETIIFSQCRNVFDDPFASGYEIPIELSDAVKGTRHDKAAWIIQTKLSRSDPTGDFDVVRHRVIGALLRTAGRSMRIASPGLPDKHSSGSA